MLRIGYWLGSSSPDGGGVGPYGWRLLNLLLTEAKSANIRFLVLCHPEELPNYERLTSDCGAKAEVHVIPSVFGTVDRLKNAYSNLLTHLLAKLGLLHGNLRPLDPWLRWFDSLHIDVLHVPYQTFFRYDLPCPCVVTMHDVQELRYPEFFSPQERAYRAQEYWRALECSGAVVVSFEHVRQDLIKYFGLPKSKIHVCPPPYPQVSLKTPSSDENLVYRQKYKRWGDFLLYPAQTWQHKNHVSLIDAVKLIREDSGRVVHVVCTGKRNSDFFPVVEEHLKQVGMNDYVHFVGVVPEQELHWLYKNCALVVIPTLYEAGSFPLVEAMLLGAPVVCSHVTSLPDTLGSPEFTFDPLDVHQMAQLIVRMIDSKEFRAENILNSQQQIGRLMKISSVPYIINVWDRVIRNCGSNGNMVS